MKRKSAVLGVILLILCWARGGFTQRLPQGKYHTNRERSIDILHYRAELRFDFSDKTVFGKSDIRLVPLRSLDAFSLDAIHLQIQNVRSTGKAGVLKFRKGDRKLSISLNRSVGVKDTLQLHIEYTARPKGGMYFRPDPENAKLYYVTTYGEAGLHANWLPIYNDVNDKFSSEMLLEVPPPYVAISNGKLIEKKKMAGGLVLYHWSQTLPHANYLMALYLGNFEKGELRPAFGSIPIDYWVPRGKKKQGAYVFRNTTKMVEFFSNRFNYRFPWDKYDQVAVPDYAIGAMEHTGVTGHRANILRDKNAPPDFNPTLDDFFSPWTVETLISHELAHHWFGDNLTCRNLSYIWLNESFASYLMMLWHEQSQGEKQLLFDVAKAKQRYFKYVQTEHIIRPLEYHYFDDANVIYNEEHTYLKGAVVLHSLRRILGDEPFFRAMSYYLHKHQFGNVDSHDLKIAIEEATGKNLDWFFDDWVTGAGHPVFEVSYRYLPERKKIDLAVQQVQPIVEGQDLFRLPVIVTVATPGKRWQEKIWVEEESENYLIASKEKPLMVSFDGAGDLVAQIHFDKDADELIYQARHDALAGKIRAIHQLARRFTADPRTARLFAERLQQEPFWGLRAEIASQLAAINAASVPELVAIALRDKDARVRKACVLAMPHMPPDFAASQLRKVIQKDASMDVVATAISALAKVDKSLDPAFFKTQLTRPSWHNEIVIGCLQAMRTLKRPELVSTIAQYAGRQYNQYVRSAAIAAWEACAPADAKLHQVLIDMVQSPVYTLQQEAIQALGRLAVPEASQALNQVLEDAADDNLVDAARQALDEIERISKPGQ